jgi:hypothetical protein
MRGPMPEEISVRDVHSWMERRVRDAGAQKTGRRRDLRTSSLARVISSSISCGFREEGLV